MIIQFYYQVDMIRHNDILNEEYAVMVCRCFLDMSFCDLTIMV